MAAKTPKKPGRPAKRQTKRYADGGMIDRMDSEQRARAAQIAGQRVTQNPQRMKAAGIAGVPVDQAAPRLMTPPVRQGALTAGERARVERIVQGFDAGGYVARPGWEDPRTTPRFTEASVSAPTPSDPPEYKSRPGWENPLTNARPPTTGLGEAIVAPAPAPAAAPTPREGAIWAAGQNPRDVGRPQDTQKLTADVQRFLGQPIRHPEMEHRGMGPTDQSIPAALERIQAEDTRQRGGVPFWAPKSAQAAAVPSSPGGALQAAAPAADPSASVGASPAPAANTPTPPPAVPGGAIQAASSPKGIMVPTPGGMVSFPDQESVNKYQAKIDELYKGQTPTVASAPSGALQVSQRQQAPIAQYMAPGDWLKLQAQLYEEARGRAADSFRNFLETPNADRVNHPEAYAEALRGYANILNGGMSLGASQGSQAIDAQHYANADMTDALRASTDARRVANEANAVGFRQAQYADEIAASHPLVTPLVPIDKDLPLDSPLRKKLEDHNSKLIQGQIDLASIAQANPHASADQIIALAMEPDANGQPRPAAYAINWENVDARRRRYIPPTNKYADGGPVGLLTPGNIDLHARPIVRNPDGSISTVRSSSYNIGGRETLLPTISPDGKNWTAQEAVDNFRRTGQHLGQFDTPENATAYAKRLHEDQAREYLPKAGQTGIPGLASGGPVYAGTPQPQVVNPLVQEYRTYMTQAQAQGVPTVPFEQFVRLKAGAMQSQSQPNAIGMARGGSVPVAGKMVVDTNPQAETDSIPATIDNQTPAKLNSGEYVIPTDVVRYFGTKFFDGLLQKAKADDNPRPA